MEKEQTPLISNDNLSLNYSVTDQAALNDYLSKIGASRAVWTLIDVQAIGCVYSNDISVLTKKPTVAWKNPKSYFAEIILLLFVLRSINLLPIPQYGPIPSHYLIEAALGILFLCLTNGNSSKPPVEHVESSN
jgi:hypothetical protein